MKKTYRPLMLNLLFLSVFITFSQLIYSQNKIDSLETKLKSGRLTDEIRVSILTSLSEEYLETDAPLSQQYAAKALTVARKTGNKKLVAKSHQFYGTALNNRNITDSAKHHLEKSAIIYTELGEQQLLASVYNQIGNVEAEMGNYEKSMEILHKALKIFQETKDETNEATVLSSIGALYVNLGNYEKLQEYCNLALSKFRKTGNNLGIAVCQGNLAEYYFQKNDTANVFKSVTESIRLFHELKIQTKEANMLSSLGDFYSVYYSDYQKALHYYNESAKLLTAGNNKNLVMDNYGKISLIYYKQKDYKNALENAKKAMSVTDTSNIAFMQINYYLLTYCYMGLRDFPNGEYAFDKYVELTNKVYHDNQTKRIAEMEVKYQTEKKQQRIEILEKEKKINRLYMAGLVVLLALITVSSFLVITSVKHKQTLSKKEAELNHQKIKELEKDQQLMATKLVLQGEETERSRLARDLHDGLGGLLSGVKLSLSNMKGNVMLPTESIGQFDNALNLLNNSINELRRVAHNMMPEALVKFGLKDALQDFCARFGSNPDQAVVFKIFGTTNRFDQALETSLYRIAQELVNNAIKHSKATEILVQFVQDNTRVHLTVQDNGQGFDTSKIDHSKSSGLQNIRARVESFNGRLEIDSKPGVGTEIGVEFTFC